MDAREQQHHHEGRDQERHDNTGRPAGSSSERKPRPTTRPLEPCPLAKECPTLCGEMQTRGERRLPLTPENGEFEHCHIYSFYGMTEGMDAENRELVAGKFVEQIKETTRV